MWNMIWLLLLIVLSNCFYNICTKSVPEGVNTFGTLTITYLVGAVLSAILFVVSVKPSGIASEMTKINCLACAKSFNPVKNKFCPGCGREYELITDDWVLVDLKMMQ